MDVFRSDGFSQVLSFFLKSGVDGGCSRYGEKGCPNGLVKSLTEELRRVLRTEREGDRKDWEMGDGEGVVPVPMESLDTGLRFFLL